MSHDDTDWCESPGCELQPRDHHKGECSATQMPVLTKRAKEALRTEAYMERELRQFIRDAQVAIDGKSWAAARLSLGHARQWAADLVRNARFCDERVTAPDA